MKGTLSNGTVDIKGTYNYEEGGGISFTPEAALTGVHFSTQEWSFTPDKKPLPQEQGTVILTKDYFPLIMFEGRWKSATYYGEMMDSSEEEALKYLATTGARIFDHDNNELNRGDYV